MPNALLPQETVFTVGSKRWACKSWGQAGLPVILAFHGWLDNAASFDFIAPKLAEFFQLLAFDFPGHGYSDHLPQSQFYHYADLLSDAAVILEKTAENEPVVLLGHSLGAAVGVCLAALYPQWVRTCISIDALGPIVTPVSETLEAMRRGIHARLQWQGGPPRVMKSFELAVASRMKGEWPLPEIASRVLCERGTQVCDGGVCWRADARWKLPSITRLCESQVHQILAGVECPVLLAGGTEGLLPKIPQIEARKACLKVLHEQEFVGGHHLHMTDQSQGLVRWVLEHIGHL